MPPDTATQPTSDLTRAVVVYQGGTLSLRGIDQLDRPPLGQQDPRDGSLRCEGYCYAALITWLVRNHVPYDDQARAYAELSLTSRLDKSPFPYQQQALRSWWDNRRQGIVVLPTGAGKTFLATLAIEKTQRSTLVVVPTLDLVCQWHGILTAAFGIEVGVVGGGEHRICDLTVTTYDSAHLQAERLGNRFGLIVYDECHHLPGEVYAHAAKAYLAPFRLGLTATLERADGRHEILNSLIGPVVHQVEIPELRGEYLADYDVYRIKVELSEEERLEYDQARGLYTSFVRARGISMGEPDGWTRFISESSRSPEGRLAFGAYRRQKQLSMCASAKMKLLDDLLEDHRHERTLIFTQDNATAYEIARRFLVPIITHHTKPSERSSILALLREGTYRAIVTSKVLNEGVDVPEANVAVVLSGSGSVREHVQRLGRILRRAKGKRAILYEVVAASTGEEWISNRRREHRAYR